MQFRPSTLQQLKVENVIFIWQEETTSRAFQTVLAVQHVRFFFFRFLITSYKKLNPILDWGGGKFAPPAGFFNIAQNWNFVTFSFYI